jgi:carbon-monoxide dehydrogenase medium subunit
MQPASRFAIVGCAAMVTLKNGVCDRIRVAFTGVGDMAFRDTKVEDALQGKAPDESNIVAAAGQAAEGDIDILSDHFASEDYRKHLAKVYAKRALLEATSNAG